MKELMVIGKRGSSQYLLAKSQDSITAHILDADKNKLYTEEDIRVILKWGYWESFSMSAEELQELLSKAEAAGG